MELILVFGGNHIEGVVEVLGAGRVEAIAAGGARDAVADGEVGDEDEEVGSEGGAADASAVEGRPGDEEGHDDGFTGAGGEFEGVAEQIAGLGHPVATFDLVEVDDSFDGLLLAEEETFADGFAFFVALEPPFQEAAGDEGGTAVGVACPGAFAQAPFTKFDAHLVDEVVELLIGGEQVIEEGGFAADDAIEAAADFFGRSEEATRGATNRGQARTAAREKLVVLIRLGIGIADNDTIDKISHFIDPLL